MAVRFSCAARSLLRTNRMQCRSLRAAAAVAAPAPAQYVGVPTGTHPSLDYRLFLKSGDNVVSAWHDVPLFSSTAGALNFVCEIPKETKAKMECATDEARTPIKQDTKKGKLRDYPYNINWNYGMLPQTWEDPGHASAELGGVAGDNDPLDVVEIGSQPLATGSVTAVKPLGVFAMIDDGELDWKVVAISLGDARAAQVNDVADVERVFPGELDRIRIWFRDYKKPDGKPENAFGFDGVCKDKAFALGVVAETHGFYSALKSGKRANDGGLSLI